MSLSGAAGDESVACVFDGRGPESRRSRGRRRHQQPPFASEGDRERLGFDLDDAVAPAHIERDAGFDRGLAADLARDNKTAGSIHGSNHGMNFTIVSAGAEAPADAMALRVTMIDMETVRLGPPPVVD